MSHIILSVCTIRHVPVPEYLSVVTELKLPSLIDSVTPARQVLKLM